MRMFTAAALLVLASSTVAATPTGNFSGEVRVGTSDPDAFDIVMEVGSTQTIQVADGYFLELSIPSSSKSVARLKDASGKVLHESASIGPVKDRPTFVYRICGSDILFISPARADVPVCAS